jgi:rubredoxin
MDFIDIDVFAQYFGDERKTIETLIALEALRDKMNCPECGRII